jgi:hypothetical protein
VLLRRTMLHEGAHDGALIGKTQKSRRARGTAKGRPSGESNIRVENNTMGAGGNDEQVWQFIYKDRPTFKVLGEVFSGFRAAGASLHRWFDWPSLLHTEQKDQVAASELHVHTIINRFVEATVSPRHCDVFRQHAHLR